MNCQCGFLPEVAAVFSCVGFLFARVVLPVAASGIVRFFACVVLPEVAEVFSRVH